MIVKPLFTWTMQDDGGAHFSAAYGPLIYEYWFDSMIVQHARSWEGVQRHAEEVASAELDKALRAKRVGL